MRYVLLLTACLFLCAAIGRAGANSGLLFHKAQIYLASGKYLEAMGLYQSVADNNAGSNEKATALIMIGYIYSQYLDQPDMALTYFDFVMSTYPKASAAGEALFKKGTVLYQLKQYRSAHAAFSKYLARYPDARWRQSARAWAESAMNLASSGSAGSAPEEGWSIPQDTTIRVLLAENEERLAVTADKPLTLSGTLSGKVFASGIKNATLSVADGKIRVNGKIWNRPEPLTIKAEGMHLALNDTRYRGCLVILADDNRLSAVNHLDIEEYLYGVVPCEVPYTWPKQALMAQAVAARTYALHIKQKSLEKSYDVRATTASQVYGGFDAEKIPARVAVDQTRGQVLTYNGKLIVAYFHANSGGYTERPENVWGARVPYLKDQPDSYSKNAPGSTWEYFLPYSEAIDRLRRFGVDAGNIKTVQLGQRTRSGRIREVTVVSDSGPQKIAANNFRLAIGGSRLKSTCFEAVLNETGILFQGSGYGHGVGMSQWGARQMALQGHDYTSILNQYYSGTQVASLAEKRRAEEKEPIRVVMGNI